MGTFNMSCMTLGLICPLWYPQMVENLGLGWSAGGTVGIVGVLRSQHSADPRFAFPRGRRSRKIAVLPVRTWRFFFFSADLRAHGMTAVKHCTPQLVPILLACAEDIWAVFASYDASSIPAMTTATDHVIVNCVTTRKAHMSS